MDEVSALDMAGAVNEPESKLATGVFSWAVL